MKLRIWLLALSLTAACAPAHAGRSCEVKRASADTIQRALTLAEHTARTLDQLGVQAAVVGRVGRDLSEYHLRYSHMAFVYRDGTRWRVVHKLNQCGTAHAAIYRQGLGEFFLDDLFEYEAAIVVPTREAQARLLPILRDNVRLAQLNTPAYNLVAYPWSVRYQQSNQWLLETFAMTQEPAAVSRERAQAWLQLQGYEPTTLRINPFKRLGARMTAVNVAFDDHPNAKRFTDRIETVTVESVFAWLGRTGYGAPVQLVR